MCANKRDINVIGLLFCAHFSVEWTEKVTMNVKLWKNFIVEINWQSII